MTPGRELDALIAEKVMGLYREPESKYPELNPMYSNRDRATGQCTSKGSLRNYSTNIQHAWEVVEKLSNDFVPGVVHGDSDGYSFQINHIRDKYEWFWQARFGSCEPGDSETCPHAICLAALKAVE